MNHWLWAAAFLATLLTMSTTSAQEEPAASAPAARGPLPWQMGRGKVDGPPVQKSPREILSLWRIDDSQLAALYDERPLVEDENEILTKLMFRMPLIDAPQWERWCQQPPGWKQLADAPREHRAEGYLLDGRAQAIERVEILRELVPLYEYRHYYRVTLSVEDHAGPVVVCTRKIPLAWQNATELDEPVRVQALFLKSGEALGGEQPFYFAAARLGWLPEQVNPELGVTRDLVWLASLGFDVALFDDVRDKNGAPFSAVEGESFYQLLRTLTAVAPERLKELSAQPFDLGPLLTQPETMHGAALVCEGTARRVQKVIIPADFRQRIGLDHYYQIDVFIELDNQAVRLSATEDDKDAPVFTYGFPTTFCVARLPENLPEGSDVRAQVRLKGVFYKTWSYESEFVKSFNKKLRQPSPLLIGLEPEVLTDIESLAWSQWIATAVMIVVVGSVMALWVGAWRFSRGNKQFERQVLRKYTRPADTAATFSPPVEDATSDSNEPPAGAR